tara:strand:+ start:118 stop:915 length:798 start_codon:yes stop_codon:yes gene_type:complete
MKYKKNINDIINNVIWITGCARSGTTILGKILSSLKGIEYAFEPDFLFGLLPNIHKINKKIWVDLYETYIIEELFFNFCSGRRFNFKKNEDSFIGHQLYNNDIKKKLTINLRRKDLEHYLENRKKKLLIKMPDISKNLITLEKYFPKNKFIITYRNTKSIYASIKKKQWFKTNNKLPWIYKNKELLGKNNYQKWIKMSENDKIEMYIREMNKSCAKIKNKHVFVYENLLSNPNKEIDKICKFLNLKKTKKTLDIIKTVRRIKYIN